MTVHLRRATADDVPAIVAMLADDPLGATRESPGEPLDRCYRDAFSAIDSDPNQLLLVADERGAVRAVLQLTLTRYLTYRGGRRATIEGVRVHREARGSGLGRRLVEHAVGLARDAGCHVVQLTTDKARPDAIRFYEALGFRASHEGMKQHL